MRYWRFVAAMGFVGVVAAAAAAFGQAGGTPDEQPRSPLRERCRAAAAQDEELPPRCRRHDFDRRHDLGRRLVHSEAKVQTPDGFATLIVDAGEVTAVDAEGRTITIRRVDGVSVTLTGTDQTRVRVGREQADWAAIEVGSMARLVQIDDGDGPVLRRVAVRGEQQGTEPPAEPALLDV